MKELNTFFPKILHDASQDPEVAIVFLRELWPQIVGPKVAGRSRPEKLTERTLVLAVLDDTWRRELEKMSGILVSAVNSFWKRRLVERIAIKKHSEPQSARVPGPGEPRE